jgi:hypothetical protein
VGSQRTPSSQNADIKACTIADALIDQSKRSPGKSTGMREKRQLSVFRASHPRRAHFFIFSGLLIAVMVLFTPNAQSR